MQNLLVRLNALMKRNMNKFDLYFCYKNYLPVPMAVVIAAETMVTMVMMKVLMVAMVVMMAMIVEATTSKVIFLVNAVVMQIDCSWKRAGLLVVMLACERETMHNRLISCNSIQSQDSRQKQADKLKNLHLQIQRFRSCYLYKK